MTKRQRSVIFLVLTVTFFIIAPIVVLISQGYLFDFKKRQLVQAGGIFIKTVPETVTIFVRPEDNGKERIVAAKNSLIGLGGTLIKNLLPQKYLVTVSPVGQDQISWQKELEVSPLQVTKATRIIFPILKPEIATTTISTSTIEILAMPEKNKNFVVYVTNDGKIFLFNGFLSELALDLKTLTGFSKTEKISKLLPSSSGHNFLAFSRTNGVVFSENQGVFLASNFFNLFLQTEKIPLSQTQFVWHEDNDNILFALTSKGGYFFDISSQEYAKFTDKKILGLTNGYFLADNGKIYSFNHSINDSEKEVIQTDFETGDYQIKSVQNDLFLLRNIDGELSLIEKADVKKITENSTYFLVSNDNTKLIFADKSGNIFVYFLKDVFDDLLYQKDDILSLGKVNNLKTLYFAHFNWQIIAVSNTSVAVFEIDRRKPVNNYWINFGSIGNAVNFENQVFSWIDNKILKSARILP